MKRRTRSGCCRVGFFVLGPPEWLPRQPLREEQKRSPKQQARTVGKQEQDDAYETLDYTLYPVIATTLARPVACVVRSSTTPLARPRPAPLLIPPFHKRRVYPLRPPVTGRRVSSAVPHAAGPSCTDWKNSRKVPRKPSYVAMRSSPETESTS